MTAGSRSIASFGVQARYCSGAHVFPRRPPPVAADLGVDLPVPYRAVFEFLAAGVLVTDASGTVTLELSGLKP